MFFPPLFLRHFIVITYHIFVALWVRDSSVGLATRYGLDGPGIESLGVRFSAPVQTGPGAHPASYRMGTGSLPGVKRPNRGIGNPPPSSAEVKERVQLYVYSPSGPSWLFLWWYFLNLLFLLSLSLFSFSWTFIFPFYFFFFSVFNLLIIFLAKAGSAVASNAVRVPLAAVCSLPARQQSEAPSYSISGLKPDDINPQ